MNIAAIVSDFFNPFKNIDIHLVVSDSIQQNYTYIEQLQREQLARGETSEGTPIKPFYKPVTIAFKKKKGQRSDVVTLKDKGGFTDGIVARRGPGDETEITSTDPKTPFLIERYTATILGLSVASKEQLNLRLRPTLQDSFTQALIDAVQNQR